MYYNTIIMISPKPHAPFLRGKKTKTKQDLTILPSLRESIQVPISVTVNALFFL